MSDRPRIAVVGSINLDLIAQAGQLPSPGETVQGKAFARVPGGKGANQAVAAARLGAQVRMIGCVGNDTFADEATAGLIASDVELDIWKVDAPTGVALIVVDEAGETEITVVPGANAALGPQDIALDATEALLCQLEIPGATVAAAARKAQGYFCLNAAPARPVPPEVLSRADLVVANPFEYDAVDKRRVNLVALTLGADGAVLLRRGRELARARPPKVAAVDGTAAGDAFTACLLVSILQGRSHEEALRRACAAGAITASRFGAQPSLPTAAEIDEILGR